jgi:hypothetical protein
MSDSLDMNSLDAMLLRSHPIIHRIGCGVDSILNHKEKPAPLVALSGPAGSALPLFHVVDPAGFN